MDMMKREYNFINKLIFHQLILNSSVRSLLIRRVGIVGWKRKKKNCSMTLSIVVAAILYIDEVSFFFRYINQFFALSGRSLSSFFLIAIFRIKNIYIKISFPDVCCRVLKRSSCFSHFSRRDVNFFLALPLTLFLYCHRWKFILHSVLLLKKSIICEFLLTLSD